ncbi:MAG: hypothetical protein LBU84_10490, partial [Prevotella sp.]|nr:hypothetical protein [Prevotella sp.]
RKIPENQPFQGFLFSANPHFFGKIKQFLRAKLCTFLVSKKIVHDLRFMSLIVLLLNTRYSARFSIFKPLILEYETSGI